LAAKTPVYEGWKSLDFLGFSRPNRAFSMGYAGFSLKEKSRALCRGSGSIDVTGASALGMRNRRIGHNMSLTHFPLFCNQMP
jgi:hypothetical protein